MPAGSTARLRPILAASLAALALFCQGTVSAKDLTRLWYAGGNVGFHSTQDYVGSNAALSGDPRPDRYQNRQMDVGDGMSYSLLAGYGINRMLSLQLDLGYFKSDVGEVDVYLIDTFPYAQIPSNPTNVNALKTRQTTIPVTAGELTQIPVTVSAVVRFRPTATVNPWVSAGVGRVFTDISVDSDLSGLNERLNNLRIRGISDELGNDLSGGVSPEAHGFGRVPMRYPVSIEVEDGNEWHLAVGFDYFLNDRFSLTADVRYVYVDQEVVVEMKGEDQVEFAIYTEKLFRKDGSLKYFTDQGAPPNPLIDPNMPHLGLVMCTPRTSFDFDHDGHRDDLCFSYIGVNPATGTFLVQGGEINLSGFAFNIGMRFHF